MYINYNLNSNKHNILTYNCMKNILITIYCVPLTTCMYKVKVLKTIKCIPLYDMTIPAHQGNVLTCTIITSNKNKLYCTKVHGTCTKLSISMSQQATKPKFPKA